MVQIKVIFYFIYLDEKFIINFYKDYAIFTIGKSKNSSIYIDKDKSIGNMHARFL